MVHGRPGMYLEAWKFGVYITVPLIASVYYSNPETQKAAADYWQYIKYPENPNTHVKEKIQELIKEKELQQEQRDAYKKQLMELQRAAERSSNYQANATSDDTAGSSNRPSWWRRAGGWITGSN